jgi:aspartyl-tRNA(Asn)/glutamyl-tRNA(Gln) amidotransferase subunit A
MTRLVALSIQDLASQIRSGGASVVAVIDACLAQIERAEPAVRAWVHVDREGALATARTLDAEARRGQVRGPLHGVPVGIKDIFDVAGMPTTSGAPPFAHRNARVDADAVGRLRAAGAVIIGKTTTTEFAYADPAATRNPWNPEHTPGGSSSGSAAAVAARMVPLALGSQTIGSTLRPAAYCGVVGLKATHGLISVEGVTPLAWSLDHVGVFTRSVDDAALALSVLASRGPGEAAVVAPAGREPPRLGIPWGLFADRANAAMNAHLVEVAAAFARAGATVEDVPAPPSASAVYDAGGVILRAEAAAYHAALFAARREAYRPRIRELVEAGLGVLAVDYVRAQRVRAQFREEMRPIFGRYDALLMPVAPAPAPRGLETTGDPALCAPWSYGGFPAIALPSGIAPDGLPLAVQLIAGAGREAALLGVARWCERRLGFGAAPPGAGPGA